MTKSSFYSRSGFDYSAVIPIGSAPVNTFLPGISGTPVVGAALTGTSGTWTGSPAPTFTYQWNRDGVTIPGATALIYAPVLADIGALITISVTANNPLGSATATSTQTAAVTNPSSPSNTSPPVISGTQLVGTTLSTSNGVWTNAPTSFTYQWKRSGVDIAGQTTSTYFLLSADAGLLISVVVTAINAAGSSSPAVSAPTGAISQTIATSTAPVISGTPRAGQLLTTSNGTWVGYPPPTFTYQWKQNGTPIAFATGVSYTPIIADIGTTITCTVTATNSVNSVSQTSAGVGPVLSFTHTSPNLMLRDGSSYLLKRNNFDAITLRVGIFCLLLRNGTDHLLFRN